MNTNQITNETPLAFLTVGQFLELIKSEINCQTVIVPEKTKHSLPGGLEPPTFRLTAERATYCATEARSTRG